MVKEILEKQPTPDTQYTKEMHKSICNYASQILSLWKAYADINLGLGIDTVNAILKNKKLKTFEEYRAENNLSLTDEEYKNPIMQNKIKELNDFVLELNKNGTTIKKEEFKNIIKRVDEIIVWKD